MPCLAACLALRLFAGSAPVKVIFDTDMISDSDDAPDANVVYRRGRYRMVGTDGSNEWVPDENGPHIRITEKVPKAEVGRVIDGLIMRAGKGCRAKKESK